MIQIIPKMMVIRAFLRGWEHEEILRRTMELEHQFHAATVYDGAQEVVKHSARQAQKLEIGQSDIIEPFLRRFSESAQSFFGQVGMKARAIRRLETEIAAYNDGGRFSEHVDTLTGQLRSEQGQGQVRALSAVYYLHREPRAFSGGELRFWSLGDSDERSFHDCEPIGNSLIIFPSFAPHEVRPVFCSSGEFGDSRFAINCWVHCDV